MSDMKGSLHAFPDHEVMQACLEGVDARRFTKKDAVEAVKSDSGWLPVAVDPESRLIYFANVGQKTLDRWQFVYSIDALAADDPSLVYFSVPLDFLDSVELSELPG